MDQIIKELEQRIASALAALVGEAGAIRTNRPSPALVEDVKIDYMGQQLQIKQLGSISVVPPREMVITLWDPSGTEQVMKALEDSKRGFSLAAQGSSIRVSLPPLSQERRDELIKLLKATTEKSKIQLRGIRDDANKKTDAAEKMKAITEDQKTRGRKKIQELIDKGNMEIENLLKKKEKEILE